MMRKIQYRWLFYLVIAILCLVMVFFMFFQSAEAPKMALTTNVDMVNKTITDLPEDKSGTNTSDLMTNKLERILTNIYEVVLSGLGSVQNLANPRVKYINIPSGWRKEQVADALAKQMNWPASEKKWFTEEGYYYPGTYIISSKKNAREISAMMIERFEKNISNNYPTSTAEKVPLTIALKIASLIEREAAGKNDMRLISGVIWNRYFIGMPLEIDATLQYAKGNEKNGWWPKVKPADKNIKSPYNTYKNIGFPPTPIANVSLTSIQAALNPKKTNCLYYLHDKDGNFHCSDTYEKHKDNIKKYY
jgi:UPF0755 protein